MRVILVGLLQDQGRPVDRPPPHPGGAHPQAHRRPDAPGQGSLTSCHNWAGMRHPIKAALSWFCGPNLLVALLIPPLFGMVLTALLVGGGTALIHQVVNKALAPAYPEVEL